MSSTTARSLDFILGAALARAPQAVRLAAKRSLVDLIGVAIAGRRTLASRIAHNVALQLWPVGPSSATLLFDGRQASAAGVAFAGAQTIDSMDAHDGFKPAKGHAGVAVLPAALAVGEASSALQSDAQLIDALIVGYEVACRVAIAQHGSTADYHASGSWNAVGAAAVASRLLRLAPDATRHALGIAEYFGPRSPMMRVIDHPTMLKDSSSWGAMTGVTAAYLATAGFTGAPAATVEHGPNTELWDDLGERWRICEQYFKPWPVCRWAQPAIEAALELRATHAIDASQIEHIVIDTFHEALRLAGHTPTDTEQAQYAIAFPTACALERGEIGVEEIAGSGLTDPHILALSKKILFTESGEANAAFPARRLAQLRITMRDGRTLTSPVTEPPGDPERPLPDEVLVTKFRQLASPVIGAQAAEELLKALGPLSEPGFDLAEVLEHLRRPYHNLA